MNKNMTKSMNRIPSWLKGGAVSLLISAAFILLLPVFILNGIIQKNYINYILYAIQFTAVFIGVYVSSRSDESNKLIGAILLEIIYLVVTVGISIVFFDGISHGIWGSVICCTIGMFAAILVKTKMQTVTVRKKRRAF